MTLIASAPTQELCFTEEKRIEPKSCPVERIAAGLSSDHFVVQTIVKLNFVKLSSCHKTNKATYNSHAQKIRT